VQLEIRPMDEAEARQVADWHYDPPYTFYDWSADGDDLALLLDPKRREGRFFSVVGADGELAGFFEFQQDGDTVVVGLGLKPDLTGMGFGEEYVETGLEFAREKFGPTEFQLAVAAFNARAIRVYERAGFSRGRTYDQETNGGVFRFVEMTRPA
jgi:[ribosomal protein S18]-alanine N-acetyltransferase